MAGPFRRRAGGRVQAEAGQASPFEPGATPIAQAPDRVRTRVAGQVTLMRARPSTGLPSLSVTISDGTGSVEAVWSGRRALGGVHLGRRMVVEGVAVREGRHLVFRNPAYTLLPPERPH